MNIVIPSRTREQIRQSIGYGLGVMTILDATSDGSTDKDNILDDMLIGGEDDYKGWEILAISGTNDGLRRKVIGFDGDETLTVKPVLTAQTKTGDDFELWEPPFTVAQVNSIITDAENHCVKSVFIETSDCDTLAKQEHLYEYTIPTKFEAIHTVEYVYSTAIDKQLHACDAAWDESTDDEATVTCDTNFYKEGSGALKIVCSADAEDDDILCTDDITSVDISDCDCVVAWIYSTTALDAGDIHILLDNTASCASVLETLDVPAVAANTWTRVSIDLANPYSDTAIISVGIELETDKGAFTLYVDDIRAQKKDSRQYRIIPPNCWEIADGSTPKLKLTSVGYGMVSNNRFLRLTGYEDIDVMSDDSSTSEVDPDYIIQYAVSQLLLSQARAKDSGDEDYRMRSKEHYERAMVLLRDMTTSFEPNTRWIQR